MAEQTVELAPGESKAVSFEATPTVARIYQVSVDGLAGSFVAVEMAPQRYEYYIPVAGATSQTFYGRKWKAQTFTPSVSHRITSVKLLIARRGSPGILTVSIKATDGYGEPTGADLCSGTLNVNSITTNENGAWYEITLGAGYILNASTKYAIVVRVSSQDSRNNLYWIADVTEATYPGGRFYISGDYGVSWSGYTAYDWVFEEWGVPQV